MACGELAAAQTNKVICQPSARAPPPLTRRRAGEAEVGCSDAERFQLELEFVQCLANPHYLNCEERRAARRVRRPPARAGLGADHPPYLPWEEQIESS